ncbi:hypothetical protein [Microvirga rosea]|uniref:hypothetical protein n=1 Tax=Microvirga rosea TaxID=2715425 RepID=UPI001D0BBA95|nr:hypothetical protein [Microvirga rosea]MCB8820881.1 hypothetical protein [Microvirga rosea]
MPQSKDQSATPQGNKLNPGDQGTPGTPGIGQNVCRECKGSGRIDNHPCPNCGGTGIVMEEIGGA